MTATEAPPAPAPDVTPDAPPSAAQTGPAPKIAPPDPALGGLPPSEFRRNALLKAFEQRTTPELAPEPPAAAQPEPKAETPKAAKVDAPPQKAHTEAAQVQAGTPPAASPAQEPASAAEASAPAAAPAPVTTTAAANQTAPQSAQGESPAKAPALPDEYQTAEHEGLYKADPLLKRTVRSLWNDPTLSPVAKVQKIEAKIALAKGKLTQAQTAAQEEDRLWDEGDFETLRQRQLAKREQRTLTVEAERTITQLLAHATGVDPDDEGYLSAGAEAQTDDARFRAFGDWIARHSPVVKEVLTEREAALAQAHEAAVDQLKAQFAEEKKALEDKYKDDQKTAVTVAAAQARAGNPPPRANVALAPADTYVRPVAPGLRNARDLLAAGLQARDDAREAAGR